MVELLSGAPLVVQQYKALLKKNAILTRRHKKTACMQLTPPFFVLLVLFALRRGLDAMAKASTALSSDGVIVSPPIPSCDESPIVRNPCYDFVWSGNSSSRVIAIVDAILRNNPDRPIPGSKVMSFDTPDEVDEWLRNNPMHCDGALHFVEKNSTIIHYGIQTNTSQISIPGETDDPTFKFQIPLQLAAEREIARSLLGDPNFSWVVGFKEYPQSGMGNFLLLDTLGPIFFIVISLFGFVSQISSLVTEKELKLRQAMTTMGLYDSAYWLSWLTWEVTLTLLSSLLTILFGMMFKFAVFVHNSFAILFLVFFLFQLSMLSLAFMISAIISKSSISMVIAVLFLFLSIVSLVLTALGIPYILNPKMHIKVLWSLFPPNHFNKAIILLQRAVSSNSENKGISWSRRGECPIDFCGLTIEDVLKWMALDFLIWFILALYLDNIVPNSYGVRKSVFYFLNPSYWTGRGGNTEQEGGLFGWFGSLPLPDDASPDDDDVLAEEAIVKQQVANAEIDPRIAVQVRGLRKTYPGTISVGCCRCEKSVPYHAVKGVWVNLAKNQLFCLLGPNGAGKTTTFNCLTGLAPITGGDALIYGNSIRSSLGMSNIRRIIGVCPQFDILWDALSAEEHLHLFASIKGLPSSTIKVEAEKSLAQVNLTTSAHVRSGSYSGGMRRRLSVAVALIGDPKVVFLDEPTTGMDPLTRRHVWDVILDAKKGRAIVLTTHSMEEADILSDRIAIMAKGKMQCIGTSIRLKTKFGTGYVVNISFLGNFPGQSLHAYDHGLELTDSCVEAVKQLFKDQLGVVPKEDSKRYLTFVIPREKEQLLANFFAELQEKEEEFGISDIQLGLATLEEVFLHIAKQAEIECAAAEGKLFTLNLASGTSIKVPVGVRFVAVPGTESRENPRGVMVEVNWELDDSGNIHIAGHSPEIPVPSDA